MSVASFPVLHTNGSTKLVPLMAEGMRALSLPVSGWLPSAALPCPMILSVPGGAKCALDLVGFARKRVGSRPGNGIAALLHAAGLPGGVFVSLESIAAHASFLQPRAADWSDADAVPLSRVAIAASRALKFQDTSFAHPQDTALGPECFLWHLGKQLRDWRIVDEGITALRARGMACQGQRRLRFQFPYYVPSGPGSVTERRFFDTSAEACSMFGKDFAHARKRLTKWGVATCVGVAEGDESQPPLLHWHVAGKIGATVAPELHALPSLDVGERVLHAGGPRSSDQDLLGVEQLSRYCHFDDDSDVDETAWLSRGLFGASAGTRITTPQMTSDDVTAAGVKLDFDGRLELVCRHAKMKTATRLSDFEIYGEDAFTLATWVP